VVPLPTIFKSKVLDHPDLQKEAMLSDLQYARFEGVTEKDRIIVDGILRDNAHWLMPLATYLQFRSPAYPAIDSKTLFELLMKHMPIQSKTKNEEKMPTLELVEFQLASLFAKSTPKSEIDVTQ
jgi:hypothetical protein